jgi:hypothetical protein
VRSLTVKASGGGGGSKEVRRGYGATTSAVDNE